MLLADAEHGRDAPADRSVSSIGGHGGRDTETFTSQVPERISPDRLERIAAGWYGAAWVITILQVSKIR